MAIMNAGTTPRASRNTPCTPPPRSSASTVAVVIPPTGCGRSETLGIIRSTLHAFADDPRAIEAYRELAASFVEVAT